MLHYLTLSALLLSLTSATPSKPILPRNGYKIPTTSFDSLTDFNTYWAYDYPWGTDQNGAARMNSSHVAVAGGQLTLTANKVSGQAPTSAGIAIDYLSGTVYAKETYTVKTGGGYDFTGEFLAPVVKGTWPAIWLSGYTQWPPEIDLAEWKGTGNVSFNTLGMSPVPWVTKNVPWPSPSSFQTLLVQVRDANGVDVTVKFYLNGVLQSTQTGKGIVGQAFWLIIDLQMEGSSGSPGPTSATTYAVKGFSAYSYNP